MDSFHPTLSGGTGKPFDWSRAEALKSAIRQPLILAGGLNADNVATAVKQVRPYGVDVSSGVEAGPGIKDPNKLRKFIEEARRA